METNIVALIPARSGSKGIPFKNIQSIGNHPLIAYSIVAAKLSKYINDVIVTTDSNKIANIAKKYGASIPFLRPKEISQDQSIDIEVFRHYISYLENQFLKIPDLIVHFSPTAPFREIRIIDKAIEYMIENDKATGLRSMHKIRLTPYKMFKKKNGFAIPFLYYNNIKESYNLTRQTFETTYLANGHVDIIRPYIIQDADMLHGKHMKLWETEYMVDIDEPEDLVLASSFLKDKRFIDILKYLKKFE